MTPITTQFLSEVANVVGSRRDGRTRWYVTDLHGPLRVVVWTADIETDPLGCWMATVPLSPVVRSAPVNQRYTMLVSAIEQLLQKVAEHYGATDTV